MHAVFGAGSAAVVVALEVVHEVADGTLPVKGFAVALHVGRFAIRISIQFVQVVRQAVEGEMHRG